MTFRLFHRFIYPLALVVVCALLYVFLWEHISTIRVRLYKVILSDTSHSGRDGDVPERHWFHWTVGLHNTPKVASNYASNTTNKVVAENMTITTTKERTIMTNQSADSVLKTDLISEKQSNGSADGSASEHKETPMPILFKKDFKQLPNWYFEDIYLRDPKSRQTTCPQSLQHSEDPGFNESFIPSMQLFLHRGHLNMSEWNRLAHFNNPFGFMEYNYSDVKAAVDLISKPKDPLLLPLPHGDPRGCVRCAVVGTGGILNGSFMGREIDAHDYVFRMNGAVTRGYEEDVGNRTSVYVHTAFSITSSVLRFKKYGYNSAPHDEGIKYVLIPEGLRDFQWLKGLLGRKKVSTRSFRNKMPETYYSGQFDENRFYVLHPDFLRYVRNRFLRSKQLEGPHWPKTRPTNGAFTLFLALHTCDVVDAYGFITEDHSKYPNYYVERHKSKVIFYINHDYNLEIKTWKKLHDAKIMKLYQRKEESGGDSTGKVNTTLTH